MDLISKRLEFENLKMQDSPVSVTEVDVDIKDQLCNFCKNTPNIASHECLACKAA